MTTAILRSRTVRWAWLVLAMAWMMQAQPAADLPGKRVGNYTVSLRLPPDGLFAQEEVQIEFRIVDSSRVDPVLGAVPVIRAEVRGVIEMPAMPSMPKFDEIAHPEGVPGEYGLHPTFAHGGEYRLRLSIQPPGGQSPFAVDFPLAVQDSFRGKQRKRSPQPFLVEVKPSRSPRAGEPCDLEIRFRKRESPDRVWDAFETVHERKMHLIIVRDDLTQFAHEHPEPGPDGVFRLRLTFPAAGSYHLFADVAPRGAGSQVILTRLRVGGKSAPRSELPRKQLAAVTSGEITVALPSMPVPVAKTSSVLIRLTDTASGKPVTDLDPYLGAMGHLLMIHQDAVTFVHSHPDERSAAAGRNGLLEFLARPPKAGWYRGWLQFQRHGKLHTAEFVIEAAPGASD